MIAETVNIICTLAIGVTDINMFYISPFRVNPIIVFNQIQKATHWALNLVLYPTMITLGAFIFFIIGMYIWKLIEKIKAKRAV